MGFGGLHFGSLFLEKSNCNFHFFADQQYFRPSNDSEKLNNLSVLTQTNFDQSSEKSRKVILVDAKMFQVPRPLQWRNVTIPG